MSLIRVVPAAWIAVKPVTEPTGRHDAFHVKFPPVTSGSNDMLSVVPEHIGKGWEFIRWGVGFTVTVKSTGIPAQLLACGVM